MRHCGYVVTIGDRFWSKVDKSADCWEWTGCVDRDGYGTFWLDSTRRAARTHRLVWESLNGDIPKGACVCHHCDNTRCVRPDHLFVGSHFDNNLDMRRKGRRVTHPGMTNFNAKMTEAIVRDSRAMFFAGKATIGALAKANGVHYMVMFKALHGITWAHV